MHPARKKRLPATISCSVLGSEHASESVGYYSKSFCKKRGASAASIADEYALRKFDYLSAKVPYVAMSIERAIIADLLALEVNMPRRYVNTK